MKLSISYSGVPRSSCADRFGKQCDRTILADACVLITAAFALALLSGLRGSEHSILSRRRNGVLLLHAAAEGAGPDRLAEMGIARALQVLGTALILAIIQQARDRDERTRARLPLRPESYTLA